MPFVVEAISWREARQAPKELAKIPAASDSEPRAEAGTAIVAPEALQLQLEWDSLSTEELKRRVQRKQQHS